MSKWINLDGNTWDGKPISSKWTPDDKRGTYITIGWLYNEKLYMDLDKHDAEVCDKMISEFTEFLATKFDMSEYQKNKLNNIAKQFKTEKQIITEKTDDKKCVNIHDSIEELIDTDIKASENKVVKKEEPKKKSTFNFNFER